MMEKGWLTSWLPPVGFAALIFYFSSRSTLPSFLPTFYLSDKLLHGAEYAIFGLLVFRAVVTSPKRPLTPRGCVALAMAIVILYGLSDEFHQSFVPLRDPSLYDALADSIGGAVGIAAAWKFIKKGALP